MACGPPSQLRCTLIAVAAGTCFCLTAMFLVYLGTDVTEQGPPGPVGWPLPALAGSAVVSSLLVQHAFAAGSLPTAMTAMALTDGATQRQWNGQPAPT